MLVDLKKKKKCFRSYRGLSKPSNLFFYLQLSFAEFYVTNSLDKNLTLFNLYRFLTLPIHHQLKIKIARRLLIASKIISLVLKRFRYLLPLLTKSCWRTSRIIKVRWFLFSKNYINLDGCWKIFWALKRALMKESWLLEKVLNFFVIWGEYRTPSHLQ